MARPTDYNETIIPRAEKYLSESVPQNMKIPTIEGLALYLDVARRTIYDWKAKYPEFLHTLEKLEMLQKEYLTETGIFGGKEINANIVALFLKANHGMVETERHEIGGVNGSEPIRLFVNAGQGFVPATLTLPTSSAGGVTEKPAEIQSTDLAPQGEKDIHSNNGDNKASTS